jgi:2-polyprenyl-3-methyl-5-hydroxy-6-metoxy-1,4-benzoquinol methylase
MTPQISCPVCNHASKYDFSCRDLMFNHYERYDYQRCSECNFIFQHPLPTAEQISSFYPSEYEVYEEGSRLKKVSGLRKSILKKYYGYNHLKTNLFNDTICFVSRIFSNKYEVHYQSNGKLLDVGCGNGRYLDGMKKLGWQTKGVEFNEGAVRVCNLSGLNVHHGDLFSANFETNSFDVINVSHVVEHVPNPKAFFTELTRVLKKNGTLIIKTPNSEALGRKFFNTNWYANDVPRHLYLFSEKNLNVLGDTCGLKMSQFKTRTSPKIILNSLDYVFANNALPSKRIKWIRFIAKIYVLMAQFQKRGDEIFTVFTKV